MTPRIDTLSRNWWAVMLRGVFAILFGLVAILLPGIALNSIILLYAIYALLDGTAIILACMRAAGRHARWGGLATEGVVNVGAGAAALIWPGLTVLVFVYLLAGWALISGALMLMAAFQLHGTHGRWLLALGGIVSLLWGALLVNLPWAGVPLVLLLIGGYALVFGVAMIAFSWRLRRLALSQPFA